MLDTAQLKTQGLRFARTLQRLFKTVSMFPADHGALTLPSRQSYDGLNLLLREAGQFTLGFVEQRIMLNKILTTDPSLAALQADFAKRGIGAVIFEPGITLAAFRHAIAVLGAPSKAIEEKGGLRGYLQENPLDFVRVFPMTAEQERFKPGDTVLDMDSESFLMKKALEGQSSGDLFEHMDKLLRSSGLGLAPVGPGGGTGEGGSGEAGGVGESGFGGSGFGSGGGGSTFVGVGIGSGGEGGVGAGGTGEAHRGVGGPTDIMKVVEASFGAAASSSSPEGSYVELARMLKEMRPEMVLSAFPAERREQLRALPPDQMAVEIIEDTAAKWAVERLARAPTGPEALIVEEEVVRVLLRSLQATQTADRLAVKLAQYFADLALPKSTTDRIQDELRWVTVPAKQKTERLLKMQEFDRVRFRRLTEHLRDCLRTSDTPGATRLAEHYLEVVAGRQPPQPEEWSRIPDLLRLMAKVRSEFWEKAAARLAECLEDSGDASFHHQQIVNAVLVLASTVANYEEFALVQKVGAAVNKHYRSDPGLHQACCGQGLMRLLSAAGVDRVIEISVNKNDDAAWMRLAATLLSWGGMPAVNRAFHHLENEPAAAQRFVLLRLIGRLGPAAFEAARSRLNDERWFVVRNACRLLGELQDPQLVAYVGPALRHPDERVQNAALTAILESRQKDRALPLAQALEVLGPHALEQALAELFFLKDPATVPALESFILAKASHDPEAAQHAVQAIGAVAEPSAEQALVRVLRQTGLDLRVRRAAVAQLSRRGNLAALQQFADEFPLDPVSPECARALNRTAGG